MDIALPKTHAEWLLSKVADGTYASIDDAIAQFVEEQMNLGDDDFDWAKEAVAQAQHDVADGRTISLDEHRNRNAERLAKIGG
jgi:Arc/MetJ-type ribon-helix-helix transcriptional regulator